MEPDRDGAFEPPSLGAQHHRKDVTEDHRQEVDPGNDGENWRCPVPAVGRKKCLIPIDCQSYRCQDCQQEQLSRQQKSVRQKPRVPVLVGRKPAGRSGDYQYLPKHAQSEQGSADCQYEEVVRHCVGERRATVGRRTLHTLVAAWPHKYIISLVRRGL